MNRLSAVCCLACLSIGAALASAQPPAPSASFPNTTLHLSIDSWGDVDVRLFMPSLPTDRRPIVDALRESLGSLDAVREETNPWGWSLHARGRGVFLREGWTVEGTLDFGPLLEALRAQGYAGVQLFIDVPAGSFRQCSPKPDQDFLPFRWLFFLYAGAPPQSIRVVFGCRPQDVLRLLPLALILLAALGLTLWQRRQALREPLDQRHVAWFRFWRRQRRRDAFLWAAWCVTAAASGAVSLTWFVLGGVLPGRLLPVVILCVTVPPALTVIVCRLLSGPVFARVPEAGWTPRRYLAGPLWGQGGLVAILVCLSWGFDPNQETGGDMPAGVLAVGLLALVCLVGGLTTRAILLTPLPRGELRDRLFELAEEAQVRPRLAYLLPPGRWRLVNALGLPAKVVYFCAELLPHLSRREVNALLVHELACAWRVGWYTWRGVLRFYGMLMLLGIAAGLVTAVAQPLDLLGLAPLVLLVFSVVVPLPLRHLSARYDRDAQFLHRDPEALITALAKLRRLGLLPVVAGEEADQAGAPSLGWARLVDVAIHAGIPPERLQEILDGPGTGSDGFAPLDPSVLPRDEGAADTRAFSTAFKKQWLLRQFGAQLALAVGVPTALISLAWLFHPGDRLPALACLASVVVTPLACRLAALSLAASANRRLLAGLREELAKDGLTPEAWGGLSAGLAPDPRPCSYEGFMDWDAGFVVLVGDRLCYLGERARFALVRRQITEVRLGPGAPSWRAVPRLYVTWRDEERGTGGTFHLSIGDERSGRRQVRDFLHRLQEWRQEPDDPSPLPDPLCRLISPQLPAAAGVPLGLGNAVGVLILMPILRLVPAFVLCALLGLPFGSWGGAAEYVLLAVALGAAWDALPYFRYGAAPRVEPAGDN